MSDVDLGAELEEAVSTLIASGRFGSRKQVLQEGVRVLRERTAERDRLDEAIEAGLADVRAGRVVPADDVFDRLQAKYGAMSRAAE